MSVIIETTTHESTTDAAVASRRSSRSIRADLILTVTTGGVGRARTPEVYITDGQTVKTRIEGIGELVNVARAQVPAALGV